MEKIIENNVRGVSMKFMGHTRSLELCARMNYETENLDFIDEMHRGEVYYDLGACEGRFTLYAALKGISCFAFEPEQRNYEVFQQNLKINNLTTSGTVKTFPLAVGEKNTVATIKIGQPWAGGHQKVVQHGESRSDLNFDFKEEQQINIVSLDDYIRTHRLPVPAYLKVDVDGSELPFLRGATQTLKNPELKKILFELSKADPHYDEVLSLLKQGGFHPAAYFPVPNEKDLFNILFQRHHSA